jgi:2-polyprenyl-3-methyl-5-hydroxy-6-metoxy-1,4-benzoquinol methylase
MSRFQTRDLVGVTPEAFRAWLDGLLELRDHEMEGFRDPQQQRDLSVRFHWGHDHDFGDFRIAGRMGDRHLRMPAMFHDELAALPLDLAGKHLLDIGCWTGGLSLLLCAMGAERVVAIEEVRKYADCVSELAHMFGLDQLEARRLSLYELGADEFQDAFDVVALCGVIYHVTDPVLALRHAFNALRDGGTCLVETQMADRPGAVLEYWGPRRFGAGTAEALDRSGWNWFVPTEEALAGIMEDVGFRDVRCCRAPASRLLAAGVRHEHADMLRAGLSVPGVR